MASLLLRERKRDSEEECILKMGGAGLRRGENRGAGRSKRKISQDGAGQGRAKVKMCEAEQNSGLIGILSDGNYEH